MIILSHVSGMPVNLIEHILRNFTKEYEYDKDTSQLDGTMYRFLRPDTKIYNGEEIVEVFEKFKNSDTILQIQYPSETVHADKIVTDIETNKQSNDKHIFLVCENLNSAELIYLYYYYRLGITQWRGLDKVFIDCTEHAHHWNPSYTDYTLMQDWELRECFSLCYPDIAQEWVDAQNFVHADSLKVNFLDLVYRPKETLRNIIVSCGLTLILEQEFEEYVDEWSRGQLKELEEFKLIDMIVESTINDQPLDWETIEPNAGQFLRGDTKLNTVSEAVIQSRLRRSGYEILCGGLNDFPTNSRALRAVLQKI